MVSLREEMWKLKLFSRDQLLVQSPCIFNIYPHITFELVKSFDVRKATS